MYLLNVSLNLEQNVDKYHQESLHEAQNQTMKNSRIFIQPTIIVH